MAYSLNGYINAALSQNTTRVIVYPNNTIAAQLFNHHKNGENVVKVSDCLCDDDMYLPMPNLMMRAVDAKIKELKMRALVVGIDSYLALLDTESAAAFMSELRNRLDKNELNANYLVSVRNNPKFLPRYEESRRVIYIEGTPKIIEPLIIRAYSDKLVKKSESAVGYKKLLEQMSKFEPSGNYTLILTGLTDRQAYIGNSVSFVLEPRDVAMQCYGFDADLSDSVLEQLLTKSAETGQNAEIYLETKFGLENINPRLALKRLLEISDNELWQAYIWLLRKRLAKDSYIGMVISDDITPDNLLRKYAVDSAISVLSDIHAKTYAKERANALKAIGTDYESLIIEFIGRTKDSKDALQFLNCGTKEERIEIVRRASAENLSYGLPKEYGELFPTLADYFSYDFGFGDAAVAAYFRDYRRLKISGSISDSFVKRAYEIDVSAKYPSRDSVLAELQTQSNTALLVVDAMGAEYMPLLLAMAKRRGMNIESKLVVKANLPTETKFNPIEWDKECTLPEIKCVDNIVHDGAEKHEISSPEQNFTETLGKIETEVMKRIAIGLNKFERVVVTADHGASRLAVIARNEGKSADLPWNGEPDNWRYSIAPQGVTRPPEMVQEYFPETQNTCWIVRGYNRLPKKGGKLYELHGGATLEEQLVPIIVFAKNAAAEVPKQSGKKAAADLVDEFEGLI